MAKGSASPRLLLEVALHHQLRTAIPASYRTHSKPLESGKDSVWWIDLQTSLTASRADLITAAMQLQVDPTHVCVEQK
jgi:hypothetical protein